MTDMLREIWESHGLSGLLGVGSMLLLAWFLRIGVWKSVDVLKDTLELTHKARRELEDALHERDEMLAAMKAQITELESKLEESQAINKELKKLIERSST